MVSARPSHAGHSREPLDYLDQIEPQSRLAARQPELSKADADGGAHNRFKLGRRQQLVLWEEADALQRHAVDASQVACVDNRHAQVIYFTVERIAGHKTIVIGAACAKQLGRAATLPGATTRNPCAHGGRLLLDDAAASGCNSGWRL